MSSSALGGSPDEQREKNISDHGVLIADAYSYLPDPGCGNYLAVITIHSYIINSKDSREQSDVPDVSPMSMEFEWDENKAATNLSKHGVAFDEAKTVFEDPLYVDFYDPDHSYDEQRYIMVGQSERGRLLIVSYTERGDAIRLIHAREATRREREAYEEG